MVFAKIIPVALYIAKLGSNFLSIVKWLDKCGRTRPLDFKPRYKVNYALKRANYGPVLYPMKLDTIKSKYPEMHADNAVNPSNLMTNMSVKGQVKRYH